jgi:hypothetical protein
MNKYLIIQNCNTEYPNIKTDVYGRPIYLSEISDLPEIEVNEQIIEITI